MKNKLENILVNTLSVFLQGNKDGRDIKLFWNIAHGEWEVITVAMNNDFDSKQLYLGRSFEKAIELFEINVE